MYRLWIWHTVRTGNEYWMGSMLMTNTNENVEKHSAGIDLNRNHYSGMDSNQNRSVGVYLLQLKKCNTASNNQELINILEVKIYVFYIHL